jgi:hypothetical protein
MTDAHEHGKPLCEGTTHNGEFYQCGRVVLRRDPNRKEEACPGGLTTCSDCMDEFAEFLRRAYDARARRKEWERD